MNQYGTLPSGGVKRKERWYGDLIQNGSGPNNVQEYHRIEITCDQSQRAANTPAKGTSDGAGYILTNTDAQSIDGGLVYIILTYTAFSLVPPDPTTTEQSSYLEEPIERHPDFATNAGTWESPNATAKPIFDADTHAFTGWADGSPYAGMTTYIVGTTSVTYTQYSTSEFGSNRDNIGKIATPPGYDGSGDWLLIASNRSKQGYYYSISDTYLASTLAWPTDWYSS